MADHTGASWTKTGAQGTPVSYRGAPFTAAKTQGTVSSYRATSWAASSVVSVNGLKEVAYYVMRARDVDCVSLTYRVWVVTTTPDTTGAKYTGTKCGASALADIVIVGVTYQ